MLLPLAIAGGLGSLIGGIFSSSGQSSANRANARIAAEQNRLNYQMFQEQNAFNRSMWDLANAYNTPLAQRQRLEDAGINPAIALGQISTGTTQSLQSASASPAVGATMQNTMAGLGQGIANAGQAVSSAILQSQQVRNQTSLANAQIAKSNAETAGLLVENKFKAREKQAILKQIEESTKKLTADTNLQKFNLSFLQKAESHQLRAIEEDVNVKISQQAVNKSVADLNKDTLNRLRPLEAQKLRADIAQVYQNTLYLVQQGQVSAAQVDSLVQGVLESKARAGLIGVQEGQIKTLIQPTLKSLQAQANLYGEQAKSVAKHTSYMGQDNARQWIGTITSGVRDIGIAVGSVTGAANQAGMLGKAMAPIGFGR